MNLHEVTAELKRIRAASHARPIQATENDISRLIASLERPDFPFPSYTLTSFDIRIEEMP